MIRRSFVRALMVAVCLLLPVLSACSQTPQSASTTPLSATSTSPATVAPTVESSPTIIASPAPEASATRAASSTAALALPTVPPTITAVPTATAFPLKAGWWDRAVCYEVFVRSFYDSNGDGIGDLQGLIAKLDYINDGNPASTTSLGANCIWLMPIMASPSYHGYDVTDYRTVNPEYGTNDDFKQLIAEAHKRGISVILDLVLNHTSVEHPWFKDAVSNVDSPYRDWFLWSKDNPPYAGPFGSPAWHTSPTGYYYGVFWSGMPDLNYRNPAVTQEAEDISRFWLQEMGVDGFRLDAIKHLIENGADQVDTRETHAWLQQYRTVLQSIKPDTFTVGEVFGGSVQLPAYFPDQLDTYFEFGIADGLIRAAQNGNATQLTAAVQRSVDLLPYQRFAPFLTNHDQERVRDLLLDNEGKAKIAATALLTLPGLPFVYYGEEIGMLGTKPDEKIRTPLAWDNTATTGGFTTGKPWQPLQAKYLERNIAAQNADPASLLNLYRRLIQLHVNHPALATGDWQALTSSDTKAGAYLRHTAEEDILVVLNFGREDVSNVAFSTEQSPLAPATYALTDLLNTGEAAPLSVDANGAIQAYSPLPTLKTHTGYIFLLKK